MAVIKFCTPNKIFKIFVYKLIFFSFCFGKFFDQFLKMNPYSNRSFSSLKDPLFKEMKTGIIQSHVENKKQQLITFFFFFYFSRLFSFNPSTFFQSVLSRSLFLCLQLVRDWYTEAEPSLLTIL